MNCTAYLNKIKIALPNFRNTGIFRQHAHLMLFVHKILTSYLQYLKQHTIYMHYMLEIFFVQEALIIFNFMKSIQVLLILTLTHLDK